MSKKEDPAPCEDCGEPLPAGQTSGLCPDCIDDEPDED